MRKSQDRAVGGALARLATLALLATLLTLAPQPAGAIVFVLFLFCGLFADFLAPYGANQISPINRLKPPSARNWFGTDNLGRDVFSRCLYGAQLSVIIGFTTAILATIISVLLGILTGYLGGKFDLIVQRFVDAWMSFPELIILIVVVSVLDHVTRTRSVTTTCHQNVQQTPAWLLQRGVPRRLLDVHQRVSARVGQGRRLLSGRWGRARGCRGGPLTDHRRKHKP